ncbi:MAG: hypothetical protein A2W28_02970 [Gammaproteobacteria bacterium RBG_16_51_14]|nr:MAG: hypothetical protein A2W28_02970 [Gammaproteobacteria bacterium RBG_16_51_14]
MAGVKTSLFVMAHTRVPRFPPLFTPQKKTVLSIFVDANRQKLPHSATARIQKLPSIITIQQDLIQGCELYP